MKRVVFAYLAGVFIRNDFGRLPERGVSATGQPASDEFRHARAKKFTSVSVGQ
jgi:hypothetical protein